MKRDWKKWLVTGIISLLLGWIGWWWSVSPEPLEEEEPLQEEYQRDIAPWIEPTPLPGTVGRPV